MKFFKEPIEYSDMAFIEVIYYAIVCPLYIGLTGALSFLGSISLLVEYHRLDAIWTIGAFIAFIIFIRNIKRIEHLY